MLELQILNKIVCSVSIRSFKLKVIQIIKQLQYRIVNTIISKILTMCQALFYF